MYLLPPSTSPGVDVPDVMYRVRRNGGQGWWRIVHGSGPRRGPSSGRGGRRRNNYRTRILGGGRVMDM